jgi:hypothetical protein
VFQVSVPWSEFQDCSGRVSESRGLCFRVQGSGFGSMVWGLGLEVWGVGLRILGFRFRVEGS